MLHWEFLTAHHQRFNHMQFMPSQFIIYRSLLEPLLLSCTNMKPIRVISTSAHCLTSALFPIEKKKKKAVDIFKQSRLEIE